MAKMVHGESQGSVEAFWQMTRYAQATGADTLCRTIILSALGEASLNEDSARERETQDGTSISDRRDVGKHAKTATRLLQHKISQGERVTLNMLVKEWRTKPENAARW